MFDMSRPKKIRASACHLISESIDFAAYLLDNGSYSSENFNYFWSVAFQGQIEKDSSLSNFHFQGKGFWVRKAICFHRAAFEKGRLIQIQKRKTCLGHVTFF